MNRDLRDYLFQFNRLPFERTQEKFRKRKILELISRHKAEEGKLLEVGPGLNPLFPSLDTFDYRTTLEPITEIYQWLTSSHGQKPKLQIINSDLEKFISSNAEERFDTIILSSVLHEIPNPEVALKMIYSTLKVGGHLFVVVPNNQSVHRLTGERIGIAKSLNYLTETERIMQQFSSYSPQALADQIEKHGFRIKEIVTNFIKPLHHAAMQEAIDKSLLSEEDLEFLYKLSELMPGFGSEIFGVATK
jgi:2-polyprenyl-3-methyl-5-hydroxy-6-metoxy-1,4-benzoquinol methylase